MYGQHVLSKFWMIHIRTAYSGVSQIVTEVWIIYMISEVVVGLECDLVIFDVVLKVQGLRLKGRLMVDSSTTLADLEELKMEETKDMLL
ncbi:hypothetical protein A4A49_16889 [Nicotiana attenuata]|uniref:Uncharacterized protein n=1 Tax=Nicotiana attenuata TaxID=49451 RepID=A0A1J6IIM5_NICAT|nr:hypothetical protein A4A49_16889 [Nicotiana attenuata]